MMFCLALLFSIVSFDAYPGFASEAQGRQQEGINIFRGAREGDTPGYQGTPPEVGFNDLATLESQGARPRGEHGEFLKESISKRPYFEFDPLNDPIAENAAKAVSDPQEYLKQEEREEKKIEELEEVSCEESRKDTLYTCTRTLLEPTIHITPAKYSHFWCGAGNHQPDDPRCTIQIPISPPRKYKDEVVTVTHEKWTSTCGALEEKERLGVCQKIREICPRGPESREVMGTLEGKPVARLLRRDCWYYRVEYQCQSPSLNNCSPLRTRGCEQLGSTCIREIGNECVVFRQKFRCPKRVSSQRKPVQDPRSLDLPEVDHHMEYQSNSDLADSITKLSLLNEMQQEIRGAGEGAQSLPQIFKGKLSRCRIAFLDFSDCCYREKGWGQSLGFTHCDGEEKALAQKRGRNLCYEVGTYCSRKVLGICTQKKKSFCCFPSKLSRILHEQGRGQLGIGWGDGENPNCRGLTTDEIARIDFSRLNLSEVFQEVMSRQRTHEPNDLKRKLSFNVTQMTAALKIKGEREAY